MMPGPQADTISTTTLVNFTAFGIDDNIQFYDATHDASYLHEAERIANRSLTRFFSSSTGAIQDEGYWAFELVNALDDLYQADGNILYLTSVQNAMQWLRDNGQDPNGHYGTLWGRAATVTSPYGSWNLNDQAAVAESYLYTGLVPEHVGIGWNAAGSMLMIRRRRPASNSKQ